MRIAFNPSTVAALTTAPNNKDITFDLRGQNIFARGVKFYGTDTNTWRDIKINNVSIGSNILDLRNGSNTTLTNINGVVTINSTWRPVVDNLTSNSATSSLSANQGRVLAGLINGKSDSDHNHDGRYLKLTGGTLTGNLIGTSAMFSGRFYGNGDDEGIIIKPSSNGYAGLILGTHDGERSIFYFVKNKPFWRYSHGSDNLDIIHPKKSGTIALISDIPNKNSWNYDDRYLKLTGGTMLLGEGLKFHANDNYFGTNADARIISLLDDNAKICDGGLIIDERATLDGREYVTELLRIRDSEFKWRGANILHSGNYSSILDSRYYTESEVNSLLSKKLDRVNLSVGGWNPRGYNLAVDYFYNGGDLSISESGGQIHVSVDGYFWQNEGRYRVLDTSDVAGLKDNLTVHQYLSNTDTTWWPLIWGGSSHASTSDSTGAVYKSHDKLSWQTSSQTLYATNLYTGRLETLNNHYYRFNSDATLRIYGSPHNTASERIYFQAGIDNRIDDYDIPSYGGEQRHSIILNPRGGFVGIGDTNPTYKLSVGGSIGTEGNIYISHATNNNMNHDTSNPRIVFSESGSQAVGLVYTDYDSYRASKGLKVMDVDNNDPGNVWFEVQGYNYSSGYVKNGSNDNYVLLGGGGHKTLSDFASSSHSHNYAANENYGGFTKLGRLPISGFYQSYESESGGNAPWSSWMHLINCQHSNTNNNYALQIAASFYDNNAFKIRVTSNSVNNVWRDIIHSGNIGSQTVANAYHLRINSANTWSTWYWAGQSGQPSWLWGSNDGTNMYVWNPSNFRVAYAASAGNADTVDGLHGTDGRTFNGNINWSSNWNDVWSDGTNKHPWYGFDHRYPNTGAYSTTITDYFGMTIKTANTLRLDCRDLLINGTSISNLNVASASKLRTARNIWGQSFDGTRDVDGTLRIRNTTSGYCEGIRIQTKDGAWSTIILGATSDSGTNANAWSIHRKDDNNFSISRNSADGLNGLVMTSIGMGLGTTAPTQRLDVVGNIRATGQIIREGSSQMWVNGRNGALLRETSVAGYHTLWSLKTTDGSWDFGEYNAGRDWNNIPVLSYITDSNYNSGNNAPTYQIKFPLASGTVALTSDILNYYWANVKISTSSSTTTSPTVHTLTATRVCAGHDPGIDNSISCSNWFRSSGNTGWYNTTYKGGWYMSDTSWIRTHNNVGIHAGQIYADSSIRMSSIRLERTNEINSSDNLFINYGSSTNVSLCNGGGNVGIGTISPTQKLDVNGNIITKGFGIQPYYLSKSVLLPTISPGDGYKYKCLEIGRTTEISCIIADKAGLMNERGILIKFNKGYDGQIILLKDLQNYGSGNGYFWVMPSGCNIIKADGSSILVGQNQISHIYDDGHSRFLVYSSLHNVWIEFLCS